MNSIHPLRTFSTCFLLFVVGSVSAQNNQREFIESSSPLSNGNRVVSRSEEGRSVQTVITVTGESIARRNAETQKRRIDLTAQQGPSASDVAGQETARSYQENQSSLENPRYPYPGNSRVASNTLFRNPSLSPNQQTVYQLPTLGIGRVRTARAQFYQDCNCNPQTFTGRVPAAQVPSLQAPPPSLNIQDPGTTFQQPVVQQPYFNNVGQPQFGYQNNNRWWTPFVSGSGVYQPVVRLANVRPGTYLGQGIIGQPTAYVDGQPLRNLLRYISP